MTKTNLPLFFVLCILSAFVHGQSMIGSFDARAQVFVRDSSIGAFNTPQYDRQLFGAESWLNLSYANWGFDFALRFDAFNNSNLRDPNGSLSDQGIGFWQVKKKLTRLEITGGYMYDQIGAGIIYRAYEDRTQLIDNALYGVRLKYTFNEDWSIRGFTGRQKQIFDEYDPIIKGVAIEGYIQGTNDSWSMAPGCGMVNRTFDDATMRGIIATVEAFEDSSDVFVPKYNTYAFSLYNMLSMGSFAWYVEGAYKTRDVLFDPLLERLIGEDGSVLYSSVSYSTSLFSLTVEGKRTEEFDFKTRPQEVLNRGQILFLPATTRENTYRLTTRYQPATQFIGELGFQGELRISPKKNWSLEFNYSNIHDLDDMLLYKEYYAQLEYKHKRKWTLYAGLDIQEYNQDRYEVKPGVPNVQTIIPFVEWHYKFSRKKSIKLEWQYMDTDEDLGRWIWGLAEYTMAPSWSFEISDMYNLGITDSNIGAGSENQHYPTVGLSYSKKSNRYALRYIKQVEGVVCSGGICRLEPAFSGFRLTVKSNF